MVAKRAKTDTVQFKLRMREALRERLEKSAKRNKASINTEICRRLDASLNDEFMHVLNKQLIQQMRDEWAKEKFELVEDMKKMLESRDEPRKERAK